MVDITFKVRGRGRGRGGMGQLSPPYSPLLPHMLTPLVPHTVSLVVNQEFAILCMLTPVTITAKYSLRLKYNHEEISTLLTTLLLFSNACINLSNALPKLIRTTSFLCTCKIPATGRTNNQFLFFLLAFSIRESF